MATRRVTKDVVPETPPKKFRPATTPQARENQMVNLAFNLAETQLRDGTASSQVISHYLKLGSSREMLEQERIANENRLTTAKIEMMAQANRIEELMVVAVRAMSSYQGNPVIDVEDELDD